MSLFVCDQCNVIANTAADNYWRQLAEWASQSDVDREDRRYLCSQCDPEIGKWHGAFPRDQWDGKQPMYNRRGTGFA